MRKGLEGFTCVTPGTNVGKEFAFAYNSWLWVIDIYNNMNPDLMTSEKQKNVLGRSDLGNDLFLLQSVIGLHFKHLIAYYVSSAANIKMIMTQSLPSRS